ncbi:hypothetical protein KC354_g157 [Hortaea werneckii]|nr:hypothetical protein KC354_g157 [Hortaea werneckii]
MLDPGYSVQHTKLKTSSAWHPEALGVLNIAGTAAPPAHASSDQSNLPLILRTADRLVIRSRHHTSNESSKACVSRTVQLASTARIFARRLRTVTRQSSKLIPWR